MKVATRFSTDPLLVVAIHMPRRGYRLNPIHDYMTFMVLEREGLHVVAEQDCKVVDGRLDDFVLIDRDEFDERVETLMWRPLAESGLWESIVEFHTEALAALRQMIADAGLDWPK